MSEILFKNVEPQSTKILSIPNNIGRNIDGIVESVFLEFPPLSSEEKEKIRFSVREQVNSILGEISKTPRRDSLSKLYFNVFYKLDSEDKVDFLAHFLKPMSGIEEVDIRPLMIDMFYSLIISGTRFAIRNILFCKNQLVAGE